jgi:branched-chain amino acid transport system permease protein
VTDLLQLLFAGISQGALYGLLAIGFVAVFTVSGVINLAQGEFAALAGLVAISASASGLPLVVAVALSLLVVLAVSLTMERLTVRQVPGLTTLQSIILTLGVSTALKAVMLIGWGPDAAGLAPITAGTIEVAGVSIRSQELWILGIAVALTLLIQWFYQSTAVGQSLRACADQPIAARLVGISRSRATLLSFAIAGLVGAVVGVLASPISLSAWDSGLTLGLKAFVAATLGGLVSVRGALLGGVVLGVLESLTAGYLDSGFRDAVAFLLLILVLGIRARGGFTVAGGARV